MDDYQKKREEIFNLRFKILEQRKLDDPNLKLELSLLRKELANIKKEQRRDVK